MRIGFFTDTFLPKNYGTELSIENFRQHLEKLGHEVFVFCPSYDNAKSTEKIWRLPSFKIRSKPIEERSIFWSKKVVQKILSLKLDICHAHTPFTAGWLAKIIAKKTNVPLVYSSHMLYPEYAKYWLIKNNKILPALMRWYLKFYGNKCQALIAPSLKMKKLLESYGVKKPIFVLPTGLDLEKVAQAEKPAPDLKSQFSIPKQNKILLYVGRITEEKNVRFLLNAFNEMAKKRKDISLVFAGDGPLRNELEAIAKKWGIASQVVFTGRLPWSEILKIYQISDLFLFASLTDTQGLIIAEAAYFGLPIVALKDDCYAGMLINNENGYTVYPYETSLFVDKILEILNNDILAQKFSQNGRQIALNFSADNQTKKLVEIYNNLFNPCPGSSMDRTRAF